VRVQVDSVRCQGMPDYQRAAEGTVHCDEQGLARPITELKESAKTNV
jgi:hypothetical protein